MQRIKFNARAVLFLLNTGIFNAHLAAQDTVSKITLYPTIICSYAPALTKSVKNGNPLFIAGTAITYKTFYAELRVNYDQLNTLGAYAGKLYLLEKPKITHVFTPQLGILVGNYKGVSAQFYYQAYHKLFDFNFLNQYSISSAKQANFYFNWSSLDFKVWNNKFLGASTQVYNEFNSASQFIQLGIDAAYKNKNTTIQLYCFNFFSLPNLYFSLFIQQRIAIKRR